MIDPRSPRRKEFIKSLNYIDLRLKKDDEELQTIKTISLFFVKKTYVYENLFYPSKIWPQCITVYFFHSMA